MESAPSLKTGVDNYIFFGLKWGQDFKNRAAHPHQEFPGAPPESPKHSLLVMPHEFFIEFNQYFLPFQSEGNDRMASMDTKITVKRLLM